MRELVRVALRVVWKRGSGDCPGQFLQTNQHVIFSSLPSRAFAEKSEKQGSPTDQKQLWFKALLFLCFDDLVGFKETAD
jgi:hypothetical protein